MIEKIGNYTKLLPLVEMMQKLAERMVVYKTFSSQEKRIATVNSEVDERCLAPIWRPNKIFWKRAENVTIEAQFESSSIAREICTCTLKSDEVILLLTYMR